MSRRLNQSQITVVLFFLFSLSFSSPVFSQTPSTSVVHTIESIAVIGNTLLDDALIEEVTAPFIGKELSLYEIQKIADALTAVYREHRFFLAHAYLPGQEIKGGNVQIAVMEGTIGQVEIIGNQFYQDDFIKKHFIQIDEASGVQMDKIRRSAFLLNGYPDLKTELLFQPGTEAGTSDLQVTVKDNQPTHLELDYNNFGARVVSRHRFGLRFEIGNLIADGHLLSLRVVTGIPSNETASFFGEYTAPIGYTGKKGRFVYGQSNFEVGQEFTPLGIHTKTESVGFYMSDLFLMTAEEEILGTVGFEANNMKQTMLQGPFRGDRIRVLRGEARYHRFSEQTRDFLSAQLSQGLGSFFGGTKNNSSQTSRMGADGFFTKVNMDWTRVRLLPAPYFIPHPFSLLLLGAGQVSLNRLVVGEQFVAGGPDSVRGYSIGESLGDHGYRLSAELRVSPFPDPEKIQVALFLDHGGTFTRGIGNTPNNDHILTGVGFGVRFNFPGAVVLKEPVSETQEPGYILDYRFQIRADFGFPMGERFASQGSGPVFYIKAIGRF